MLRTRKDFFSSFSSSYLIFSSSLSFVFVYIKIYVTNCTANALIVCKGNDKNNNKHLLIRKSVNSIEFMTDREKRFNYKSNIDDSDDN